MKPIPTSYSVYTLCERFCSTGLRKELHTTKEVSTSDHPIALLAKQRGSKGGKGDGGNRKGKGNTSGGKTKKLKGTCWGFGKKGHYERDCRSKKTQKGGQSCAKAGSSPSNAPKANRAPYPPALRTELE